MKSLNFHPPSPYLFPSVFSCPQAIPDNLGDCKALRMLDVSGNQV